MACLPVLSICLLKSLATYLEVCVPEVLVLEYKGQDEVKQDDHLISLLNKAYIED